MILLFIIKYNQNELYHKIIAKILNMIFVYVIDILIKIV